MLPWEKAERPLPPLIFPPPVTASTLPLPSQPHLSHSPVLLVLFLASHPLLPSCGPFPEMALAEVTNDFHDASFHEHFKILLFSSI